MDLSASLPSTSTSAENPMSALSRRESFFATYRRHQPWSIPDSIIYYIAKNPPSAKFYEKMIQVCKYFFNKNPILVIERLIHQYEDNEWKTLLDEYIRVDLCDVKSSFWITEKLRARHHTSTGHGALTSITPKIYQSDIKKLSLRNQTCSLNDVIFLAAKCEDIVFREVTVLNDDGTIVALEKLFEHFPVVDMLDYRFDARCSSMVTSKTVSELLKIPTFLNLGSLYLYGIPQSFDITGFFDYIKKNKETRIFLSFCEDISEQYKALLQTIVDEILDAESHDYRPPCIDFPGIDEDDFEGLFDLY